MPGQLIFDQESMINGNIFKFEQRLNTQLNKFIGESGAAVLANYFSQDENASTVDRGSRDIDQLFGKKAPTRYISIKNFPLHDFGPTNPENTDEKQIEDINVNGECIVLPSTIVPKPMDFFTINHLKVNAIFEVTNVVYDSMKVDGFYKINYILHSTSKETIDSIMNQVTDKCYTDLNAIGTSKNPIIREKDYIKINQIKQMIAAMIESYRALFYNKRHNCFLYHDPELGEDIFDMCGNEFMAKHSIMNNPNSTNVIVLHDKISDKQMPFFYNNSVYNWLEIGAPMKMVQRFYYLLNSSKGYPYSSFYKWNEEVQLMQPLAVKQGRSNFQQFSFFDDVQLCSFMESRFEPTSSEYDKLIWRYIHKGTSINYDDVSLDTADALLSSIRHRDIYLYTPIAIFIMRKILQMN